MACRMRVVVVVAVIFLFLWVFAENVWFLHHKGDPKEPNELDNLYQKGKDESLNHGWDFLYLIDAPTWTNLTDEISNYNDIYDYWFQRCHPLHHCLNRQCSCGGDGGAI